MKICVMYELHMNRGLEACFEQWDPSCFKDLCIHFVNIFNNFTLSPSVVINTKE